MFYTEKTSYICISTYWPNIFSSILFLMYSWIYAGAPIWGIPQIVASTNSTAVNSFFGSSSLWRISQIILDSLNSSSVCWVLHWALPQIVYFRVNQVPTKWGIKFGKICEKNHETLKIPHFAGLCQIPHIAGN